jgi:uncharacterized membrane protein YfcA
MEILAALIAGVGIGAVLGFIGAGGAMLTVPILIYLFGFSPLEATTAALAVVCLASLSGVIPKARNREVLYKEAFVIWALGLVTNIGASILSHRISDRVLTTGLALVLSGAATSMLQKPIERAHKRMPLPVLISLSLLIGLITGFFGIGGGFVVMPILILGFGTPLAVAAGTSLLIIAINSATAFLGHYALWDEIDWHIPVTMAISAVVIAGLGSRMHASVNPVTLKRSFATLLYSIAIFTVFETWFL